MTPELRAALEAARGHERTQAHFYRALAAATEDTGLADLAERFHDLHADEQHHLSRLTARLVEAGQRPGPLPANTAARPPLDDWEDPAREREAAEIARYQDLLATDLDPQTRELIEGILAVERRHHENLGGKWTLA